jgi:hypothetical protein
MGVAGQNPTLIVAPDRLIRRIGIVAEHKGRGIVTLFQEYLSGIEAWAPQIISPYELYSTNDSCLVAEQGNAR